MKYIKLFESFKSFPPYPEYRPRLYRKEFTDKLKQMYDNSPAIKQEQISELSRELYRLDDALKNILRPGPIASEFIKHLGKYTSMSELIDSLEEYIKPHRKMKEKSKNEILEDFHSEIPVRMAKIFHVPYSGESYVTGKSPWFIFLIFSEGDKDFILQKIKDFESRRGFNIKKTFKSEVSDDDHPHNYKLYKQIENHCLRHMQKDEIYAELRDPVSLVLFVDLQKVPDDSTGSFYHVSYSGKKIQEEGLMVYSTIKYSNRIYLWKNLSIAKRYAMASFKAKDNWQIYQVDLAGMKVWKDNEEIDAVYVEENIPVSRLKLILSK